MPIVAADIVVYGSSVMPTDDVTTQIGGAISLSKRVVFTDIDPAGLVEILSSSASDVTPRAVTIYYLDATGTLANETQILTGTTPAIFAATMAAILRIVQSAGTDHVGTLTIRKSPAGATLAIMEITPSVVLDIRRPHYNALANPTGGATKTYYEKVFIKNWHATLALTDSVVIEQADPDSVMAFALETVLNGTTDNGVGNNRLVSPSGFTFDSTTKDVANGKSLTALAAQGVWLQMTLVGGKAPADTSFTLRLQGVTA